MSGIELIIQFTKLLFQLFFFSEHAETLTGFACFVHRVFISPKIVFFPFFIFCVFAIFWVGKVFVPLCDPAFQKVMILVKINITRRNDGRSTEFQVIPSINLYRMKAVKIFYIEQRMVFKVVLLPLFCFSFAYQD